MLYIKWGEGRACLPLEMTSSMHKTMSLCHWRLLPGECTQDGLRKKKHRNGTHEGLVVSVSGPIPLTPAIPWVGDSKMLEMLTPCWQVTDTKGTHYMPIIDIFHGGGFQSWPLIIHYLFHYSIYYSRFGFETHLMVTLMNSIMVQNNGTLKAPNMASSHFGSTQVNNTTTGKMPPLAYLMLQWQALIEERSYDYYKLGPSRIW